MKNYIKKLHEITNFKSESNQEFVFPTCIGKYKFKHSLFDINHHRSFKYAIYADGKDKAFAKIWFGSRKNYDYYSLSNEIENYDLLNKVNSRMSKNKEVDLDIRIPKKILSYSSGKNLTLLTEYIGGKTIGYLDVNTKLIIYEKLMNYFEDVGKFSKSFNTPRHSTKKIIYSYPIFMLVALIKYPGKSSLIIKTFPVFLKNMMRIIFSSDYVFVHRSLEDQNIIKKGKYIYPIDFQLSVIGHPYFEIAQTIIFSWNKKNFVKNYLNGGRVRKINSIKNNREMLRLIFLYTALQQVVFNNDDLESCFSFMKYFLNQKYE